MNAPVHATECSRAGSIFGLTFASEIDLPELSGLLVDASNGPDVSITDQSLDDAVATSAYGLSKPADDVYHLRFNAAMVRISGGDTIEVDPDPSTPHEILRHLVLGPAVHSLLHQRGRFVLHASTVEIDGQAVAFLGESGRGKTTTAAACLLADHRVVSDDVAAIEFVDGRPYVRSGYPAIKLSEAFVERFDPPVGRPRRTWDGRNRHFYPMHRGQPADSVPLDRIYLLDDGDREAVEPIDPAERLATVAMHTYAGDLLSDPTEASVNFSQCARLVDGVAIQRLVRRRQFEILPDVVNMVEADG